MELSIIVPVYNMASDGKLEYCLNSLLAQSLKSYEIIAVDDASTDDSLKLLSEYAKRYPEKIRVIASKENHHQGGARNLGIQAAEGEFVGFMDSDDWAAPDMYEKLLSRARKTGADVVGCDYSIVYEHGMTPGRVVQMNTAEQTGSLTEEKKRLLILKPGSMVVKIYRRELITKNRLWFPEDIFYEDNCMAPLWMIHGTHFERVEEPLYFYYQHEDSTVHHISLQKCKDRVTAMELLLTKAGECGIYERFLPELMFKYTELGFVNTLFSCMGGRMKGRYRFVRQLRKTLLDRFPRFAENEYYQERINREEKKLIGFLVKSQAFFFLYYRALYLYRTIRKKGRA